MKDAADILMEARPYIDKGWCQGMLAQDERGYEVEPSSPHAVAWCVTGALIRSDPHASGDMVDAIATYLFAAMELVGQDNQNVTRWNDVAVRTKEEVLEAIDRAISLALDEEFS